MEYAKLPGTGLQVSRLSLGTMMFGDQTNEEDSLSIMHYAHEQGINFWDTANTYNGGRTETIVGKALKGRRDDVFLATKVFYPMSDKAHDRGLSRSAILRAVEHSLKRLDTDYIDLYYLHAPDYETDIHETMDTMNSLVKAGKVRYVGISNFAAWQAADLLVLCEKYNYTKPVYSQNIYNLLTRAVETELLPFLRAHKMDMAVYNPIAGGLLSGKHKQGTPGEDTRFARNQNYYNRYWSDENFLAVDKLSAIAKEAGLDLLSLSLKWAMQQEGVGSLISGVSKLSQLEQNIKALEGPPLDSQVLTALDGVYQGLTIGGRFPYNR